MPNGMFSLIIPGKNDRKKSFAFAFAYKKAIQKHRIKKPKPKKIDLIDYLASKMDKDIILIGQPDVRRIYRIVGEAQRRAGRQATVII